ncbi:MAG: outer membrane protein assembly factor BamA [Pseudomonadota bacterium]
MRLNPSARHDGFCRPIFAVGLVAAFSLSPIAFGPESAQAQAQTEPQAQSAEQSVVIRGNRRIEVETILSYMNLQAGQSVSPEDLNRAARRLFDTGLFKDVQIIPTQESLIVEVIENPSINEIAFEGNDGLEDEDLQQIISLRPRLPFTVSAAEADAQAIIEVYRRTGRYGAEVEPVIIERSDNRVDLVFEIVEGDLTEVSAIDFVGNQIFSDRRLRGVIETTEGGFFSAFFSSDIYDPDRLELDKELLREYYFERGYADFTVLSATAELTPERDGFFITFSVSEGELYTFGETDVSITARGLDVEEFQALIPDDLAGEDYNATLVEEIANDLTDLASQRGFAFVQVRTRPRKNEADRIIDVTFEIIEGPKVFIDRIEIAGNTATLDRVVRRNIELVEGDPFDARKIRRAERAIRSLGYFSRVEIDSERGSAEDRAVLKVKVEEQSTGSLSFGIGFSTGSGPIGSISLSERNFLGRGQIVRAQLTAAGDTQVYDFAFTEPRFLDRDLAVGIRAFFIDDDQSDESNFELARLGFSPSVSFPLSPDARIQLRYEFLREDVQVNPLASPAILPDDGVRFTSRVGYRVSYDQRNDVIEPTRGYLLTLDQDFAGLGGDSRYTRVQGTAKTWYGFLGGDVVASLELQASGILGFGTDIRINERFFLGGDSLRGFESEGVGPRDVVTDDALGGNNLLVSRLEVSFPLGLPEELGVFGGFFVDAGTLFGLDGFRRGTDFADGSTQVIDDELNLRVGAGALLFVQTPFGPLQLSLGWPVVREDFDNSELFRLSVGTRF